ncbi:hypothetical protein [Burkholderia diffusa]|uniref:hypothetical protein n=1 Tax=Burkholderia diffusa TaxID=488732 RepID=UPI000ADB6273|nr:hypothetical protein [Burkholderia diffusa]
MPIALCVRIGVAQAIDGIDYFGLLDMCDSKTSLYLIDDRFFGVSELGRRQDSAEKRVHCGIPGMRRGL